MTFNFSSTGICRYKKLPFTINLPISGQKL